MKASDRKPKERKGRTSADDILAAALASGKTVADACKAARVSESTAFRRLKEEDFATRVKELRDEMVKRAAGRLADSMDVAVLVLRKLLTSADENVKYKAAVKIVELSLRVGEVAELAERVAMLEAAERERQQGKRT